jgi:hypothetical protein
MADEHVNRMRYTLCMEPNHWWQWRTKLVVTGIGSSLSGNELLIKDAHGGFYSVNYARVLYMKAEPVKDAH